MRKPASDTPLGRELKELIALEGPIPVERYMALCLGHPRHGYYLTRDPFGESGDFVTAPEISQMFGELIGLWAAEVWRLMGSPRPVRLVELGPGRGTLMADTLRAARAVPAFREAIDLHLVETSPVLRERQRSTLAASGVSPSWHEGIETLPSGPAVIVANEFFDALPVRQYVMTERGWCERLVGLDEAGALAFGLSPMPEPGLRRPEQLGSILELPAAALALVSRVAERLSEQGGALLAIDYGHDRSGLGETLQALKRHRYADPLAEPGEADLTVHVDFGALGTAARRAGAAVHGPVAQGAFLNALGIRERAAALARRADERQREAIRAAVERLTEDGGRAMGLLFKCLAVAHPDLPLLPGFDRRRLPGDPFPPA